MKRLIQFFKDSYAELQKVVWPTRDEVRSNTIVVLVSVAIFAVILGLLDYLLVAGIDLIF